MKRIACPLLMMALMRFWILGLSASATGSSEEKVLKVSCLGPTGVLVMLSDTPVEGIPSDLRSFGGCWGCV